MKQQFDIAIVGAGILGSFSAFHAIKKGQKVLLIEAGKTPRGATVRNFGQVVPSGQCLNGWRQIGIRSLELYREVAELVGVSIQENGSLYVASDEQEQRLLHEICDIDKQMGYPSELVKKENCFEKIPCLNSEYVKEGLSYPNEITLDSPRFLQQFIRFLQNHSQISYVPSTTVTGIEKQDSSTKIILSNGEEFTSKSALICCGHQLNRLFSNELLKPSIKIARLQMLASEEFPSDTIKGNLLTGLTIRRYAAFSSCPSYAELILPEALAPHFEAGIHILFKQAPSGELIIGDSHNYYDSDECDSLDFDVEDSINQLILDEAKRIVKLPELKIKRYWNGYYAQDNEKGVFTRSIDSNIHVVTGIGGKGMTTGPALMEKVINTLISGSDLNHFHIKN